MAWGDFPWTEALHFKGSAQVALGKKLLERYRWWEFRPHPEWIEPHAGGKEYFQPYAAGIPGETRLIYFPWPLAPWVSPAPRVCGLEPGVVYHACYYDPASGKEYPAGQAQGDASGAWTVPMPPIGVDIVLVLEKVL
jgi:hypothetical protein